MCMQIRFGDFKKKEVSNNVCLFFNHSPDSKVTNVPKILHSEKK